MTQITMSPDSQPERAYQGAGGVAKARTIEDENNTALFGATAGLVKTKRGTLTTSTQITVTTTPTLLLAANAARIAATFQVFSGSAVYLGGSNGVSVSNAPYTASAGNVVSDDVTTGAWYGICASGTALVGVAEVS